MLSLARKLGAVALALAGLLFGLWLWSSEERQAPSPLAREDAPVTPTEPAELEAPPSIAPTPSAQRERVEEAPPSPTPTAAAPACVVFGRVVDEEERGLGVAVQLYAYKVWADGHDVPRLPGKYDLRGWEVRTDREGLFHFSVPVPTKAPTQLRLTPDPFHDSAWLFYGGEDAEARPPLHAGENDLGTFRLVSTGAIRGRVVSDADGPLAGAELRIAEDRSSTLEREAESDASGSYQIDHVKPGSYGVAVEAEGYLSEFRKPFEVRVGLVTEGVDFRLRAGPILGGRVVDEEGRGIEGARLWGWPASSGSGAGAKSGPGGDFTIHLPQDEPYTLEVELVGYDSFGLDDHSKYYAPGTSDLTIALRRSASARTRFRVVDADTGAPVELFGLEIERDRGSGAGSNGWTSYRANPRPETHPGGELELDARPALDLVTVCAPGYVRQQTDVRHDGNDGHQTVALVPGGSLLGSVKGSAGAVAGAAVRLQFGSIRRSKDSPTPSFHPDDTALQTVSDSSGRFRFEAVDPATYQLVARGPENQCVSLFPVTMPARGNLDVGELELVPGATILGQVLVPPGHPAAGLEVYLDIWQLDVKCVTDADGRFRFEGLTAGAHGVLLAESPGRITSSRAEVTLAAGESREVVLDARNSGTCSLELTLELSGAPAAGLQVDLLALEPPERRHELGLTDAEGRVSGWAPVFGQARVELRLASGRHLTHPDPIGPLELDHELEATVRFEVGGLRLALPPDLVLPPRCRGTLILTEGGAAEPLALYMNSNASRSDVELVDGALRCAFVPQGEYELALVLTDESVPSVRIPADGGGFRLERPAFYKASARVRVSAGAEASVELH